jgi:hypothetical protein
MKNLKLIAILLPAALALASCSEPDNPGSRTGMKPVYISKAQAYTITIESPRTMDNPGKIYIMGSYLFIVERSEGVHVIDNSNPSSPVKLKFIGIPGVIDVAVKGHTLYADNITDLLTLDISDVNNITLDKRIKDVYPVVNQMYPAEYTGYFECADTSKGLVIGWEEGQIPSPKCYRSGGSGDIMFDE